VQGEQQTANVETIPGNTESKDATIGGGIEATDTETDIPPFEVDEDAGGAQVYMAGVKPGDKTPQGTELTEHGAERVNEREFSLSDVDNIVNNNRKNRVKQIDEEGQVTWRYQDSRGNTVITNEWGDKIVTVYSHPEYLNDGKYIPNPNKK
jgi:hypothetical protein